MSTRRPALHALALVACAACDSASSPTEIMVVVDSDLDVPAVLSHVDVAVYAADGRGERLGARSFALVSDASGGGASNAFPLPLSFALAPAGEGAARSFRLAVTGSVLRSGALTKIVDTALVASFAPGRALRLDVFLSRGCADASCSNDASGVAITTCVAPGTCVPVPMRAPLPPYEGGPLGGYTPALPVGSDAGSVVEPPVGSAGV
jgi:hypothetical protein